GVAENPDECLGRAVADAVFLPRHVVLEDGTSVLLDRGGGRTALLAEAVGLDAAREADLDLGIITDADAAAAQPVGQLIDHLGVAAGEGDACDGGDLPRPLGQPRLISLSPTRA